MIILTDKTPIDDIEWNTYPEQDPVVGSVFVGMEEDSIDVELLIYGGDGACYPFNSYDFDWQEMPKYWINTPQGNPFPLQVVTNE